MQNDREPGTYSPEEIEELTAMKEKLRAVYHEAVHWEKDMRRHTNGTGIPRDTVNTYVNTVSAVACSAGHYAAVTALLKKIEKEQAPKKPLHGRPLPPI